MAPVTAHSLARAALIAVTVLATPTAAQRQDPPTAAQRPKPPVAAPAPVSPAVPPTVRAGVDLWRAGDWQGAVAIWQPFAAAGDADAMFNLGQAYKLGRAVPVDKVLARDWYRKAAVKNHLPAQANLGILLFQAGEKPEAARWLKAAADRGEMRAQYVLGVAHWNGDGAARSLAMAYAYLTRASAQGLTEATGALGNLSRSLSPADRANGAAIAASLAAGNGVPAMVAAPAPAAGGITAADLNRRGLDTVQKPPPRPAATVTAQAEALAGPPSASIPALQSAASKPASPPPAPPSSTSAVPQTAAQVAPVVRKVELPVSAVQVVVVKPADQPRPVDKPTEKLKETGKPKATDPLKAADKTKIAEKAKASDKAKASEPPAPGWRVQLGAFGSKTQAETSWGEISKKQKSAIGKAKPIYDPGRGIVKLQIGPYKTRADAKAACAKLAFAGQACFVTEG